MTLAEIDSQLRGLYGDPSRTIKADYLYAWTWHCRIVSKLIEQGEAMHEANTRVRQFMNATYGVDTKAPPSQLPPV